MNCSGWAVIGRRPNHNRIVTSAPGPEISGNASGNTDTSARRRSQPAHRLKYGCRIRGANTISSAIRNSSRPPKMRKAWMLMPIAERKGVPISENVNSISAEIDTALYAILRLEFRCGADRETHEHRGDGQRLHHDENTMKNLMT